MVGETWGLIMKGQDVRQNLSLLRQELKKNNSQAAASYHIAGNEAKLIALLKDEDAKTRKNAALLMGDLGKKEFLKPIYEAYEEESQLFVKSSYLTAMKEFDYREYLDGLKKHLKVLEKTEMTVENQKHLTEEMRELTSLIVTMEGVRMHQFTGFEETYDVILLTNRNFPELTLEELKVLEPHVKYKVFGAGIMARVENLDWISKLRTYQELLFSVKGMQTSPMDAEKAAKVIINSDFMRFLSRAHSGNPPYYFRIEFKTKMELDKKSAFTKKLSVQLEKLSDRKLINTTSNYEIEIRLIENKSGECNILVKLFTLPDERFAYRQEVIPMSIRPTNAALTVALAKKWLTEGAQVLDPFCGVGTMLIERHMAVPANTSYGIDIQGDAIEKAKVNTRAAHQIIHYINRDSFTFQHEYLFDEMITDMPFVAGRITEGEIKKIYEQLFAMAQRVMKKGAIMVLYSHNRDFVRDNAMKNHVKLLKEFEISRKEGTYVEVLKIGE